MNKYGGSGIAFVLFGLVAVLLIGFAMFGGPPRSNKSIVIALAPEGEIAIRTALPLRGVDVDVQFTLSKDLPQGTMCRFFWRDDENHSLTCYGPRGAQ